MAGRTSSRTSPPGDATTIRLTDVNVADVRRGDLVPDTTITVVDLRIAGVERGAPRARPGTSVVSLDGAHAGPAHAAAIRNLPPKMDADVQKEHHASVADHTVLAGHNLLTAFAHGTTGVRVVDSGLHPRGMGIPEAADKLVQVSRLESTTAVVEAARYAISPIYAASYLIGKLLLLDLRRRYFARHPMASLRQFHDRLLSYGALPVGMIEPALLGAQELER